MAGERDRFLLEILCEEIPANALPGAVESLRERVVALLRQHEIPCGQAQGYGTPRRLALLLAGLGASEPSRVERVTGPPKKAAFDGEGKPTRAAEGFARAHGLALDSLGVLQTAKGEVLGFERQVEGRPTRDILKEKLPSLVTGMAFPKTMRWGDGTPRFVRAVRNVTALYNDEVLALEIFGIRAGAATPGHRFLSPGRIELRAPESYPSRTREAFVIVDAAERRRIIEAQLLETASQAGGRPAPDPVLLEQVTNLVEHPLVILGRFDDGFLALPREVLAASLRDHQKCFTVEDAHGTLLPWFQSVADHREDAHGFIRRGNEWVLHGRLRDAEFFWREDRKTRLEERYDRLGQVVFLARVGSYRDKAERLQVLVRGLGLDLGLEAAAVEHCVLAARLSKCDLVTAMVGEFASLQGIMGGLYAREDGVPEEVSRAIYDQYAPRSLEEPSARGLVGALLGVADRVDTLTAAFLVGAEPTGTRDPHGLRRAAQGLVKTILDHKLNVGLEALVERSMELHKEVKNDDRSGVKRRLLEYLLGRITYALELAGHRHDTVAAATSAGFDNLPDLAQRVRALGAVRGREAFGAISAAHKRINNILKGREEAVFRPEDLAEDAERDLYGMYVRVEPEIKRHRAAGEYDRALEAVASMRAAVDCFFDKVLVMAEEERLRSNRLALLRMLAALFSSIADFSKIVPEAGGAER